MRARPSCLATASIAVVWALAPQTARAQYPPITSRDFNREIFQDPTLGESLLVAMARAIAAIASAFEIDL